MQLELFPRFLRLTQSSGTIHGLTNWHQEVDLRERNVTVRVSLPGGQNRLRQMILHVASRCREAQFFGAVKLNKIIWKADFDSFAARRVPVTGREYLKQKFGPALREMVPVQRDMLASRQIEFVHRDFGDGFVEERTVALVEPDLSLFSEDDLGFVEGSLRHYWNMTGTESSDESHGIAWRTRAIGVSMPYESAVLSDKRPPKAQWERLKALVAARALTSD